jgi:hypothetical protein
MIAAQIQPNFAGQITSWTSLKSDNHDQGSQEYTVTMYKYQQADCSSNISLQQNLH